MTPKQLKIDDVISSHPGFELQTTVFLVDFKIRVLGAVIFIDNNNGHMIEYSQYIPFPKKSKGNQFRNKRGS